MGEGMLKDVDDFDLDPGSEWDQLSNELDDALPNLDRWDVEIRKLLPDESRPGNAGAVADLLVGSQPVREEPKKVPQPIREVSEVPANRAVITSEKQLLFFILKYKDARKICAEAGDFTEITATEGGLSELQTQEVYSRGRPLQGYQSGETQGRRNTHYEGTSCRNSIPRWRSV